MASKRDQNKISIAEVKAAKKLGLVRSAVNGAKKWFKKYFENNWSKQAYSRLVKTAKARGMTPQAYAEKVLLK